MQTSTALKWAGVYLGLWIVTTGLAGGLVAAGIAFDGLSVVGLEGARPAALDTGVDAPTVGIGLVVLGGLVWQLGTAAAAFRTGVSAVESETARHFDAESMKSDILTVLDDRMADMQQDVSQTRRLVNRMSRESHADQLDLGLEDEP
jgi:hypothetical protein